jgi:phage-related protein
MKWTVRTFNDAVDEEIAALPDDIRLKLERLSRLIEMSGPSVLPPKATKHLENKLWELRLIGRDGIARVIYITITEHRVILLRAFMKKKQKTPASELEVARRRARSLSSGSSAN